MAGTITFTHKGLGEVDQETITAKSNILWNGMRLEGTGSAASWSFSLKLAGTMIGRIGGDETSLPTRCVMSFNQAETKVALDPAGYVQIDIVGAANGADSVWAQFTCSGKMAGGLRFYETGLHEVTRGSAEVIGHTTVLTEGLATDFVGF